MSAPAPTTINIGLCGFGTVGQGVWKHLSANRAELEPRLGVKLNLARAAVRDPKKVRGVKIPARKLTAGQGVDLVVETAGAGTLQQSIRATRLGGMITLIGMVSGAKAEVNLPIVSMGSLRIHGIAVGSRQHLEQVIAACGTNGIRPVIDCVLPLANLAEAVRFVESGQQFGKVCVEI